MDDGVRLAYAVVGEGPPLVVMHGVISHLEAEWRLPPQRSFLERLARHHTVLRYDPRGLGFSDRSPGSYSLDRAVSDAAKLIERTLPQPADVFSAGPYSEAVAIAIAARRPDIVRRLILWGPEFDQHDQHSAPSARRAARAAKNIDSEVGVAAQTYLGLGRDNAADFAEYMAFLSAADDAQDREVVAAVRAYDHRSSLGAISCPTLVLHRTGSRLLDPSAPRKVASHIGGAALETFEGASALYFYGDVEAVQEAIERFLAPAAPEAPGPRGASAPAVHAVLFTDLVGHTAMMSRLGDARGREVLREHERLTREALAAHGGSEVKSMGDGFMASFASPQRALECAIALQQAITSHEGEPLSVRVGVNAGEPIAEDNDLFGASVIAAARIAAKAEGGEILVSNVVRELVTGKGFLFSDTGEHVLKGMEEPMRIWQLRWAAPP